MEKKKILAEIERLSAAGELKRSEVLDSFTRGMNKRQKSFAISRVLYYLGGGIVVAGIFIFVAEYWAAFNDVARVLITFGAGIAAYLAGEAFYARKKTRGVGNAFHFMAGILITLGVFVLAYVFGVPLTAGLSSVLFAILTLGYILSFFLRKTSIALFFSIIFATFFYFAFTEFLLSFGVFTGEEMSRFSMYQVFAAGLAYLFFGFFLYRTKYEVFSGYLYGFGALGFLGAGLALSGWNPNGYIFWETIYPFLAFGVLFTSIHARSRTLLVFGALGILGYLVKITAEYFTDSFGWPLSLVVLGFALVLVGYLALRLDRKLQTKKNDL